MFQQRDPMLGPKVSFLSVTQSKPDMPSSLVLGVAADGNVIAAFADHCVKATTADEDVVPATYCGAAVVGAADGCHETPGRALALRTCD